MEIGKLDSSQTSVELAACWNDPELEWCWRRHWNTTKGTLDLGVVVERSCRPLTTPNGTLE